jgi:hypothetical protein
MVTQQYVTGLLRSNVLLGYHGNEISKPLHSNGHVLIDAHVGGSHTILDFFLKGPIYLQSVTIHSANGGKGEGYLVEEYSVALLC